MDVTKLIIALVVILLTAFPNSLQQIFPGNGNVAEQITETVETFDNEPGIYPLEEGPSSVAPVQENWSTQGDENETSMMSDF